MDGFALGIAAAARSPARTKAESPAEGNAPTLKTFFLIETIGAMAAATFAAVAALEVVLLGETLVAFGRVVEIFALDGFIFVILCLHDGKGSLCG